MAVTVFPENGDAVTGAVWQSLIDSQALDGDHVVEGLELTDPTGLFVDVEPGRAIIAGAEVKSDAAIQTALTASQTNYVYFNSDGTVTVNTTGTQPANSVYRGKATTDGSAITALTHYAKKTNAAAGILVKTAEETNATTTYAAETDLTIAVGEGQVWEFYYCLEVRNTTGAHGIKVRLTAPSGAIRGVVSYQSASANQTDVLTGTYQHSSAYTSSELAVVGVSTSPGNDTIQLRGVLVVGDTAGSLALEFAENSTGGAAAGINANSFLLARRVRV